MTDPDAADVAAQSHVRAIAAREAGDYLAAEAAAGQAVCGFEAALGADSPDLASAWVEWGRNLQLLDRLPEARAAFARAVDILTPFADATPEALGGAGAEAAAELLRLTIIAGLESAGNARALGHLAEAESACRVALARVESRLPGDDPLLASALNDLGIIHKFQGRLDEAEAVYARALAIADATGAEDLQATLLHNLGGLAHARGEHARGEPLARRSVELRTALLGADHPTTAADRAAWAALLAGLGETAAAEQAHREALATFERHLGPDSLEVAFNLTALAGLWRAVGRPHDAEVAYRRAVDIRALKLGDAHFDLAMTLNDLGMLLGARGQLDEALTCVRRAATVFAAALGAEHPHTAIAEQNLRTLTALAATASSPTDRA